MIPYTICIVQEYPVTINGKVDWKKLEEIASAYYEYDLANPQNELEEELAEIWKIVLGVSKIGTNCNFFEWGGHSLKANSIVFEVEKRMGITCKSQNVFQNPTITEFAVFLTKQKKGLSQEKIEKNTENIVRVTEEQSRLYWATKMSDDKLLYNVVDCVRIQGEMDIEKIKYSFSKVVELHDSFRLSFYDEGGVVYSEIHDEVIPKINYLCIDEKVIDEEIQKVITPFEFEDPSLVRLHLLQAESKKLYLVIDAHHMVLDGISLSIIQKELSDIYNGTLVEKNELDYLDYVQWKINKPEDTDCMQYWTNRLSGVDTIAALPADQIKKVKTSFRGQSLYFPIEDSEYLLWEKATRSCGCTMFTYLSAVYAILLQKYCQEENIVLGTVTSNRDRSEFESMVGMFVNTLPLRIDLDGEASFINYVKKVQADFENDMRFQNVSLDSILDTFGEIGESKQLPFSNVIVLQNMDVNRYSFGSNSVKRKMINVGISKFDVSFIFNYLNGKIELEVEYSTDIYQKERIFNVVKNYFNLLHFISSNIEKKISELTLGEISEIKKDYQEINSTSCELIGTQPVHELIFEHSYADHYAIVQDDRRITYDELETMVHNLSACLFRNGVHSGDRVGVIMHGSIELVVSWMAILEVGAVLMPLSPEYPEERIGYILKDSGCKCLLGMEKNDTFSLEQILVDHHHLLDPQEQLLSKPPVSLNDIAYIIYTSGSTGTPKGVKISHKSLLNLCEWHIRYFEITSKDKSTKYAGEGFDASIWEVFPALLAGAELHIISQNIRLDLVRLNEYFNENQITVAFLPTQVCEEFTKLKNISLRCLLTGGDKLDSCMNNQYIVYNNYGPTENTVVSTCFPVVQTYENIPIGKPISNTHVYVCDTYGNILPKGIAGELIVSGLGISRGYVNDEEQTKSKFKALSYDQYDTAYFTGDIVKFDGENLIFLGRQDNQVKIRGYRIEVNEIQSVAQKYELIDDCIIACQDTFGKKQVNCYYLSQEEINVSDFKQYMRKYLPEYMIPKTFTQITQIPMNANGKIDYRKLVPNIEEYGYIDEQSLSAEEQALLAVWKNVLGLERIEANKNFFELGGDSIKAMKMMSELMSLGSTFSMKEFFENPTFHSNSNNIMQVKSYDSTILKEDIQLLPIQKWFLNKKYTDNTYFCMTEVLEFENVIDQERLLQAFEQVMECHEILKAVIYKENNKWNQKINSKSGVSVKYVKENRRVTGEAELLTFAMLVQEELRDNMNSNVSIGLCQMDHVNYCIVSINHLFIDAYSFRIIIDDFIKCYEVNESVHLVRTASVNEWAKVYEQYYHQNSLTEDITYWQSYYQVEKSSLSKAYVLEKSVFADSDKACAVVDEDVVSKMIKNGDQAYGIDILMLTALSAAVQKTFGNQKVEINLENFGRNCIYPDIEISRTIGWLTNKYPILLEVKSSEKWINRIIETKKAIESVPNRGFFHDYIVNELSLCGDNMKDPQISFNYLGQYNESYHDSKIKYSNFQLENGVDSKIQKFFDLDINARVSENGKMYIDLDYNRYEFKKSTITALMAEFSQNIRMIVDEVF